MGENKTSDQDVRQILGRLEFLQGVSEPYVNELAALAEFVDFPEGTILFNESDPASYCYVIVDGRVLLEICGATGCTPILTVGEGDLLGWSPVLGRSELTATARALTATRAIQLSGRDVSILCERVPEFGFQFMRCTAMALAKRLTATRLQLIDLYGKETPAFGEGG